MNFASLLTQLVCCHLLFGWIIITFVDQIVYLDRPNYPVGLDMQVEPYFNPQSINANVGENILVYRSV